ncbi:MAG: winged helix-turn-helix domain-containing protein [Gammaproteobacteria bacterium]|nr:winged helix-turn-helix domain-containing protein [Gammaproteobacteria bacterium]
MTLRFEDFILDTELLELRKDGTPVAVEPQAFDLIAHLAENADRVVDRDELIAEVWRGRIVSDAAISTRINAARRALDDDGRAQRVIKTVPRRGFRFVAEVHRETPVGDGKAAPCFVIAAPRPVDLLYDIGRAHDPDAEPVDHARLAAGLERGGGQVRHSIGNEVHAVFADAGTALDAVLASRSATHDARGTWRIALGSSDADAHAILQYTDPGEVTVASGVQRRLDASTETMLEARETGDGGAPVFVVTPPADGSGAPNTHPAPHCRGLDLPLPEKPSIIILPFTNLGGDDGNEHLATGLRLDVQTALVKISGMLVIAAGPANSYAGRDVPAQQVGREMGVRYVLEGTVQRTAQRLRVTAQLTHTQDNRVVWAERYDPSLDDPIEVQDEITRRVVTALDVKLAGGEQARVWRKTLRDPQALDLFYRGLTHFMRMTREDMAVARGLFERVFELAADVALGPTYLAICHWWEAFRGWSDDAAVSLALAGEWGERAVAMEDADGQAHGILAHVHVHHGRHDEALRIGAEGVAIRPLCANTNAFYASVLNYSGFHAEAIERMRGAIRYSPIYAPWWLDVLASAYLLSGDPDRAVGVVREALRLNRHAVDARLIGAAACVTVGWGSEARYLVNDALAEDPALSAQAWCTWQPYRDQTTRDAVTRALVEAGLPEAGSPA